MRIISKSIADSQFFSNNSFTYFWESFQTHSYLFTYSKWVKNAKYVQKYCGYPIFIKHSFMYFWESFHMVKFQIHS